MVAAEDGTNPEPVSRVDLVEGDVDWTIDANTLDDFGCWRITFSVPDDRVWCADFSGVIRGRSLTTGELDGTAIEHQRSGLSDLAVQSAGGHRYLVAFGAYGAFIGRWQLDGGGPITHTILRGHSPAEYSPDGQHLLVVAESDEEPGVVFSVWDTDAEQEVVALTPEVLDTQWLDGDRLGAISKDGHGRIIDVGSGSTTDVPINVESGWSQIARVGQGRIALGYNDGHIDVFDFDAATKVVTLRRSDERGEVASSVGMMTASEDGTRLYAWFAPDGGIYEFDVTRGRELRSYSDTSVQSIAVAGEGPIAVGHIDGTVTLHDPDDLRVVGTLPGARSFAWVIYDGAGRFLLVVGGRMMSLYDVARRQRMGDPIYIGDVNVDLRPDGLEIATGGSGNDSVQLWSLDPETMTEAACHIAGRNLTHAEWDTYIGDLATYHATCSDYPVPED